ncbi:MAG: hypothetical protein HN348_04345 [Proteobacteria bacterium]|jgi:hypothetical protein|nr:hypothetical protein [Pseudomonadota bacterium]
MSFFKSASIVLYFTVLMSGVAIANPGVQVTVQVFDADGAPISHAGVRHPEEKDIHKVNVETGAWTASVLYLPQGDELVFAKKMELEFEVSAAGYKNALVKYKVRKRKNILRVVLEDNEALADGESSYEDPIVAFGRDKPLDIGK